jgi:hypothetical protein
MQLRITGSILLGAIAAWLQAMAPSNIDPVMRSCMASSR